MIDGRKKVNSSLFVLVWWVIAMLTFITASAGAQKTVVTLATSQQNIPELAAAYEEAAALFNRLHPDVEARIVDLPVGQGSTVDRLIAAVAAGVAPDIVYLPSSSLAHDLFQRGISIDLAPILERLPEWRPDDHLPMFIETFRWKGHLIGLPGILQEASILFWNRESFESVGLDGTRPPTGLYDLLENYTAKLTQIAPDGRVEKVAFRPLSSWFYGFNLPFWFGADVYDPATNRLTLDTEPMHRMLDWLQEITRIQGGHEAIIQSGDPWFGQFANGGLAMFQTHSYLPDYGAPEMVVGEELLAGPPVLAEGATNAGTLAGTDATIVLRTAGDPLAAVKFAHFLILGEGSRVMTRPWQSISASRSINFDNYETWDARRRYIADAQFAAFESARAFPALPEVTRLHDGLARVIVEVVTGQTAPIAGLQELERTLQAVLDERAAESGP